MNEFSCDIFQFWGKADEYTTLPAVCHMLDIAFVAQAILSGMQPQEQKLVLTPFTKSGLSQEQGLSMVVLLIALHDIGKLTPGFQYKLPPSRRSSYVNALSDYSKGEFETNHGLASLSILANYFVDEFKLNKYLALGLFSSVASHHGVFLPSYKTHGDCGNKQWHELQVATIHWLASFFNVDLSLFKSLNRKCFSTQWFTYMSGLCCVADWVGSDSGYFTYCSIDEYAVETREQTARSLVNELMLKQVIAHSGFLDFVAVFNFKPNALQRYIVSLIKNEQQPWLTVIESGMGSGKTEAALILADNFIRQHGHSGLYIAMPSQATANQLFKRTTSFLRSVTLGYQNIELHLKHSNADFEPHYEALRLSSINNGECNAEQEALKASQWFTAKKRGLLAGACVGTIDQLLMGSMLYKHNFVRLFGLANKVVILDEVHSLQSFQLDLLKNALHWMAKLHVRVVILSATLPKLMREELVRAYGESESKNITIEHKHYPRVTTYVGGDAAKSHAISVNDGDKSEIDVFQPPTDFAITLHATTPNSCVTDMAKDVWACAEGAGSGVYVCILNTVSKVQALAELIANKCRESTLDEIEYLVFHSRYPLKQRLSIEQLIEEVAGKSPKGHSHINENRPVKNKSLIIIGSQVLEQSLDYDCCEMFTQIAPIDLLLQRVGRVWRHQINNAVRANLITVPRLNVYLPAMDKVPEDYAHWFGFGEVMIYPSHVLAVTTRLLWEKAKTSNQSGTLNININRDIDDWINNVYADAGEQLKWLIQEADKAYEAKLESRMQYQLATQMMFDAKQPKISELLKNLNSEFDNEEIQLNTRLASVSVPLVLLVINSQNQVIPITEAADFVKDAQAMSEVKNSKKNTNTINWLAEKRLSKNDVLRLKQSQITVSHVEWVAHFINQIEIWPFNWVNKSVWQKTPTLFNAVPVILDSNNRYEAKEVGVLELCSQLGLKILNKRD